MKNLVLELASRESKVHVQIMHLVGQTDLEMGLQPGYERSYKLKVQ